MPSKLQNLRKRLQRLKKQHVELKERVKKMASVIDAKGFHGGASQTLAEQSIRKRRALAIGRIYQIELKIGQTEYKIASIGDYKKQPKKCKKTVHVKAYTRKCPQSR